MSFSYIRAAVVLAVCAGPALAQPQPAPELRFAVVVSRHGVRAPTWTVERLNQYSAASWPEFGVPPANLTAHGRVLMKIMGAFYHDWFAGQKLLSKDGCAAAPRVYIWTDTDQRTVETGKALAEGLFPGCTVPVHSTPEDTKDALFDPISAGVAKPDPKLASAAVKGRVGPDLAAVIEANRPAFETLQRVLAGDGKAPRSILSEPVSLTTDADGIAMAGPLRLASTLTENLLLEYADGMTGSKLGWGRVDAANLRQMLSLHAAYADLMRRNPYLAKVRGSNLLSHIVRSLQQAVEGKSVKGALGPADNALVMLSGHDTNLSNLSGLLDLSWVMPSHQPNDAPPGSALIFSLWQSGSRYSVRVQFLSQTLDQMRDATPLTAAAGPPIADLFIPGCSSASEGFSCDWAAFLRLTQNVIGAGFVQ